MCILNDLPGQHTDVHLLLSLREMSFSICSLTLLQVGQVLKACDLVWSADMKLQSWAVIAILLPVGYKRNLQSNQYQIMHIAFMCDPVTKGRVSTWASERVHVPVLKEEGRSYTK